MNVKTIFVLGAGFTRAFCPRMPLLRDTELVEPLRKAARGLPTAARVLDAELRMTGGEYINVERLMTRLDSGVPFDDAGRARAELTVLLATLKSEFVKRIEEARETPAPELGNLAGVIRSERITCLTFNYDDVLDEQLYLVGDRRDASKSTPDDYWDPDWGYGVPLRPVNYFMGAEEPPEELPGSLLLKLHGSINWRIRRGYAAPYPVNAIVHRASWVPGHEGSDPGYETFLEKEPLILPPVLLKTELPTQPLFRAIWARAGNELNRADEVIFIGYSLPVTDLAARALFSESIRPDTRIKVVDLGKGGSLPQRRIRDAYADIFPSLRRTADAKSSEADPFVFRDARLWARDFVGERGNRRNPR